MSQMIDLIDWTPRLYPSLTILEGRFVRLEPLNKTKHAEGVCQMCLSEDAHERFRYFGSYPPKSEEEELAWLEKAEKKKLIYVIIDKIREDVVGTIEFYNPVLENGTIEIFVYFSKMIAKKSGGTEALYLVGSFIFDKLKYRRLEWCTDNRNEASKNAATRFGFVYETLHPQNRINKKELIDIAYFSIIDKDWSIIKKSCEKWLDNQNFDENGNQKERLSELRRKIEISSNFFIQTIDPPPPVLSSQESDINAKAFDLINWTDRNLPSHTIMEGKYVRLEPLSIEKHGDALFEIVSQEKQRLDYLPEYPPKDRDQFQQWLIMAESSQDPLYFTIIDKATGKVAGRQALSRIRPNHGVIEMGHVLWSSLIARKPAATEACYLFAKHVFDNFGYHRFEWKCDTRNQASKNSALRFGFEYEGSFRQFQVRKGQNCSVFWLAMLSKNWPVIKQAFEEWLALENFDENGQQKRKLADVRKEIQSKNLKN